MTDLYDLNEESSPPPRSGHGRRILANLGWLAAGALLAALVVADPFGLLPDAADRRTQNSATQAEPEKAAKQLWTCGMHPQVIQDHPGPCPICGMDLVPLTMDEPDNRVALDPGERKILFYRNPMDPMITSPVPSKDSMGMDYVPVYADEAEAATQGATVRIDPAVVQNMNVVTAPVETLDLTREIRTVGYLDFDQQRMVSVTTKYSGFIERVYVNYVGEPVRKGQPLFEIYSPELVQTQEELLSALSFSKRLAAAPQEARRRAEALAEAARIRLGFWDISDAQIRGLEEGGKALRTLTVSSPASGIVMMRMPGLEGLSVKPGMELFHLADLSTLWLSVEVFEDQLPWLREGSQAEVTLSYFPGESFHGRVRFVEPQVSEKTRTVGLRLEVPNPDGRLRAGMYATVRFAPVVAHDAVAVPTLAITRTGERNLVVVAMGGGRFAPREVSLGAQGDQFVQVLSGLAPGDQVVTSAQFLLDSESNLREAIQKLIGSRQGAGTPADGEAPKASPEHAGH